MVAISLAWGATAGPWGGTRDLAVFAAAWSLGWLLLWRLRPLPAGPSDRPSIAVVVPARDEALTLDGLLARLGGAVRADDELVVVDDHSSDGTAAVAAARGVTVLAAPPLPTGWSGKAHACWHGARATSAPILLFLDADVTPPRDLLDRIAAACARHPGSVISVQPWHTVGGPAEHLSLLCNVAALMGAGRFSALAGRFHPRVAFGPVLAVERIVYDRAGGHAAPGVRGRHTEDIGLARAVGRAELYTGRPDITFRMYPGGWREVARGWTRSLATGALASPAFSLLTAVWVAALAGGWIVVPITYPFCALQVWVLGRRAGTFSPWLAVAYPVAVGALVAVTVRSAWRLAWRRPVVWKRRSVPSR